MAKQNSVVAFEKEKTEVLSGKTPQQYVKQKPGPGGRVLNYVAGGYIIEQLNKLTGFRWSFEIKNQGQTNTQVWVLGKLTLQTTDPQYPIVKEQFGSKAITSGVDLGDQFKAAATDALKKCASLVGIAKDIYWPDNADFEELN